MAIYKYLVGSRTVVIIIGIVGTAISVVRPATTTNAHSKNDKVPYFYNMRANHAGLGPDFLV